MSEPGGEEYVWRFKLSDDADERLHADALTEMVRRQLKALLGCVVLTDHGSDVRVTGFRFLEGDEEFAVYLRPCEGDGPDGRAEESAVDSAGDAH